jgi:hypothetical protein
MNTTIKQSHITESILGGLSNWSVNCLLVDSYEIRNRVQGDRV